LSKQKILWLVSWYPNEDDQFDGDFIARHANAASLNNDVHVLFVTQSQKVVQTTINTTHKGGLTEEIIYFRSSRSLLSRISKQIMWFSLSLAAVKRYIKLNGKPDHVHVHVAWKAGLLGLFLRWRFGFKYYLTEHSGIYVYESPCSFSSKPSIVRRLIRLIFRSADKVLPVSSFLAEAISKNVVKNDCEVLPNVVDDTLFKYQHQKNERFTFIHVSNMAPVKNIELLLNAMYDLVYHYEIKDAVLILVGNRDATYHHLAKELGLTDSDVQFIGEVCQRTVANIMQQSHCFVLSSLSETFSCVTAEALCCGLPVIATRVGAVPELVDQSNGILIDPNDRTALTKAMLKLKSSYSSFDLLRISQAASAKFNTIEISRRFDSLYGPGYRVSKKNQR